MNTEIILTLNDPNAKLEIVGGKGASLARLANAGFLELGGPPWQIANL